MVMHGKLFFDTHPAKNARLARYREHGAGPSTSASDDHSSPPPYYLEQFRFPMGGKIPQGPFVTISQLKAHLGLLRAFRELENRVTDLEANRDVRDKLPPLGQKLGSQQRWVWFLELALERQVFCGSWSYPIFADF